MTKERAFALKPGDELFWVKRPPNQFPRMPGAYSYELFARTEGESVKFVEFAMGGNFIDAKTKISLDAAGLPIIVVRTRKGTYTFSANFE